jgi:hypothetical protein
MPLVFRQIWRGLSQSKKKSPTCILGKQGGEVVVGEKKQAKRGSSLTNADEKWWVLLEGLITP